MFFLQINHTGKGFLFLIFREIKLRKYSSLHKIFYGLQLISINISQISLQQLPIPKIEEIKDAANIIQISKELLKENDGYYQDLDDLVHGDAYQGYSHDELVAELNARVMLDFNLTRQEVVTLMHTFESAAHKKEVQEETQRILDCYDRLSEDR